MALFQVNLTDSEQKKNLMETAEWVQFPAFLATVRWVIIAVGLPLNILVAWVILRTRQLHNPRNAFWLGNVFCHSVTLLKGALEAILIMNPQQHPKARTGRQGPDAKSATASNENYVEQAVRTIRCSKHGQGGIHHKWASRGRWNLTNSQIMQFVKNDL